MIDIESVRRDTPSCARLIHFNNAGASLLPVAVTRAVEANERKEGELGAYEAELHDACRLAERIGVAQPRISDTEKGGDMLVSTLSNYVEGLGYQLKMTVVDPEGHELAELDPRGLGVRQAS